MTLRVQISRLFRDHSINLRPGSETCFRCSASLNRIGALFSSMLLHCILTKSRESRRQCYLLFELSKNYSQATNVIGLIRIRQDLIRVINDILMCFNQLRLSALLTIEMELRQSTFDICNTFLMYVQRIHRFNPGLKASLVSSLTNMMYSATAGTIRTWGFSSYYWPSLHAQASALRSLQTGAW